MRSLDGLTMCGTDNSQGSSLEIRGKLMLILIFSKEEDIKRKMREKKV